MARNDGWGNRSDGRRDRDDWQADRHDRDSVRGREGGSYGRDTGNRRDPGSEGRNANRDRFDAGFDRPDWESDEWTGARPSHRRAGRDRGPDYGDDFNPREGFSRGMSGPDSEWGRGIAGSSGRASGPGERGGARAWGGANSGATPNYSGRGPKNYRRSDDRVIEDINEALTRDPDLDATDIEVRCEKGEVVLVGLVESRRAKRLAEDVAESVSGVRDVDNRLKVDSGKQRASSADREMPREAAREARNAPRKK